MDGASTGAKVAAMLSLVVLAIPGPAVSHGKENVTSLSLFLQSEAHHLINRSGAPNMTYIPALDPGGQGQRVNTVETGGWLAGCQSNSSSQWRLTAPVCSTKFSSFALLVLATVVLAVITLWTILGNVLVLFALYRYRYLRTMSNCLIGNLAVSDLLLAVTVLPISTANDLLGYWVFGRTMCTVWLSIDVLYCTASIWGLCTIAFDRYTATVYPMWYHDQRSPRKALAYMLFVWVFSIVISLAPFIGWQDMISGFYIYSPSINRHLCILFSTQSYVIYSAMGSFILPSCLMTFLYVQIFVVLHTQSDNLKKKTSLTLESVSPVANGCPTIAISPLQDSCGVVRDTTTSTLMGEDGQGGRDRDDDTLSSRRTDADTEGGSSPTFHLEDRGLDRRRNPSATSWELQRLPPSDPEEDAESALLRDQRSNSLNVEMDTFRRDSTFLAQPKQEFLAVSTCDIPLQFRLKKSRSAAFSLQENGSARLHGGQGPALLSSMVPRSKSVSMLSSHPHQEGDSQQATCSLNLHRCSLLPWQAKRRNPMTTSMRRRFQLREQRATKRMLLIMACFFVCWVPFTLMYMLRSLCPQCQHLDDHVAAFIIWLGYVNSSLNPLLYTLFNDDFRKAFKKILTLRQVRRRLSPAE